MPLVRWQQLCRSIRARRQTVPPARIWRTGTRTADTADSAPAAFSVQASSFQPPFACIFSLARFGCWAAFCLAAASTLRMEGRCSLVSVLAVNSRNACSRLSASLALKITMIAGRLGRCLSLRQGKVDAVLFRRLLKGFDTALGYLNVGQPRVLTSQCCFRVCFPWGCFSCCFFACASMALLAFCSISAVSFGSLGPSAATIFSVGFSLAMFTVLLSR